MSLLEANIGNGWFSLPTPKPGGYYPSYTHFENTYRDARGYLHRDITRSNVAKVECNYNALNKDEISTLQLLYPKKSFQLRFTDYNGNRVEKTVYASPLKGQTERINSNNVPEVIVDASISFIEY